MNREQVEARTALRCLVGSTVYGINIGNGEEDRDEMGVCVEPIDTMLGLTQFDQFIYRSAVERTGDHNARSTAGDLDLTIYGLRKYVRLALKGNPSILALLYSPNPILCTKVGQELRDLAPKLVSKRAGYAFLGYMEAQRQRLVGERGGKHGVRHKQPGCEYDTKYAMHLLRLGVEGIELMTTGKITLPLPQLAREFLLGVRAGEYSQKEIVETAALSEFTLRAALDSPNVPAEPDTAAVEAWMIQTYKENQ